MKVELRQLTLIAGLLAALAPAAAAAESMTDSRGLLSRYGEYFLIGGGVTNYLDRAVRDRVDTGGTWDLRLGFGNRYFLGGEIAYAGSIRDARDLGSNLLTNGAEAVVRLQYPFEQGSWFLTPFAFGGAGWSHFKINQPRGLTSKDTDDVLVVPVGGGVTLTHDHLLFDTRFTYRQTFDENLVRAADGTAASLENWAVTASVGIEF